MRDVLQDLCDEGDSVLLPIHIGTLINDAEFDLEYVALFKGNDKELVSC